MNRPAITTRRETAADIPIVREINLSAFPSSEEANIVDRLRDQAHPVISIVAEFKGDLCGHIMLSRVAVGTALPGTPPCLGLGPMAVRPAVQGLGIGSALVEHARESARRAGASAIFVLGHAEYYPRFGFRPASEFDLSFGSPDLAPYFMVLELVPGTLETLSGEVAYHPAFGTL